MAANDIEKWRIGKALFVCADNLRSVNPGENRRLARRALRSAGDAETRVRRYDDAIKWNLTRLVLKDCERRCIV